MSILAVPNELNLHFPYQPLDEAENEIRIMVIAPGKFADDIICYIVNVPLIHGIAASVKYQALSYTWGEPGSEAAISLNGRQFWIRPNLEAALRRIRTRDSVIRLWVDAICIDQGSVSERNFQVKLMQDVYQNAARVLVWLGEAGDDSDEAMVAPPAPGDSATSEETLISDWLLADSRWKSVLQLATRAWWNRIWVVQEVSFAKDVLVLCGDRLLSWQLLLKYYEVSLRIRLLSETSTWLSGEIEPSLPFNMDVVRKTVQLGRDLGLLELLQRFRTRKSTDPRDKVFGLTGLVTDKREKEFEVDYSMPVNRVYQALVQHLISTSGSLNVLAWTCSETRRPGLPSWAPDWSIPASTATESLSSWRWGKANELHSASGSTKADVSFPDDLEIMMVRVLVLNKLIPIVPLDNALSSGFRIELEDVIIDMIRNKDWALYGSEEDTREAFRRTLVANCIGGKPMTERGYKTFYEWYDRQNSIDIAMKSNGDSVTSEVDLVTIQIQSLVNSLMVPPAGNTFSGNESDHVANKDLEPEFFQGIHTATASKYFFLLGNGYMGLGPRNVEQEDIVCIPLGGEVPFVIRDKGSGYHEFIGECYLHNAMNGEMFNRGASDYEKSCCTISLR